MPPSDAPPLRPVDPAVERGCSALLEGAPVKIWVSDPDGLPLAFNAAWRAYTGLADINEHLPAWIEAIHPDDRAGILAVRTPALAEGVGYTVDARLRRADGGWRWHRIEVAPIMEDGARRAWVGSAMDIHDAREAQGRFQSLADTLPGLVFESDATGDNTFVNDGYRDLTGASTEALLGRGWLAYLHPDDQEKTLRAWLTAVETGCPYEVVVRFLRHDGVYRWFLARGASVKDESGRIVSWVGASTDITERVEAEEIQALLGQEISHRVKNSLALVFSLLNLQARDLEGEARAAVTEAALRVNTVARLHDLLWRAAGHAKVDLALMGAELSAGLAATAPRHDLVCDAEAVELAPELAIPLALVVNELVTNALKHAYPGDRGGRVTVDMHRRGDRLEVEVRDWGVGLPDGFSLEAGEQSLGMRVIAALSRQLGAELSAEAASPGARFRLSMPLEALDRADPA